jgi:DNA (cytosine-5)-methyltransferase 1
MSELLCGSLFSGVGGMDIGFAWDGWRHAFFAEIEPFGRAVLAERFPGVPIYSDVRDVPECERGEWDRLDVLTFGSPCQDLSVAGKRRGLEGDRSGLFWEAMRIAGDGPLRPRALLMENVEGLLSSNGGRDFALVLDAMAERGYRWSFRVLDSQHFAVAQRRRRVFVVAIADDDPRAERIGEVLALAEGGGGDSPTREPSWPDVAARVGAGAPSGGGRIIGSLTESGGAVTMDHQSFVTGGQYVTRDDLAPTVTAKWAKGSGGPSGSETGNLVVAPALTASYGGLGSTQDDVTLAGMEASVAAAADVNPRVSNTITSRYRKGTNSTADDGALVVVPPDASPGDVSPTMRSGTNVSGHAVQQGPAVRRLSPMECERLQGWPDEWTDIPWNGKPHAPDSKRYAAAGNGVTATVAYWIAARLAEVLR